ncbi:MAG TPA: hypothetical protein VM073_06940 [Usitatibacter sp.]|nr:hypothetical protein [Usitatibacter sp.]
MRSIRTTMLATAMGLAGACATVSTTQGIDNSSIGQPGFRDHKATYGVVYRLPKDVTDVLDNKIYPPLRDRLVKLGLEAEARAFNLQHVTVVHIHSADPSTPRKMLAAFPKAPPVLTLTLKNFYNTEAATGAGAPWWFDLGVVKSGQGYTEMMKFNTVATAAMAPLRDGPLPRVTGPVYEKMGDAGKDLVRTVGVSGVNVWKDGKETASHNPHNTLMYSMTRYDDRLKAEMKKFADEMNAVLPNGIDTQFRDVSIVEIGFMGNVLREFYRINLDTGTAYDVVSGQAVKLGS